LVDSQVRATVLTNESSLTAVLSHYPSGLIQPWHRHESGQMSFLLAGSVDETTPTSDFRLSGAHCCWKAGSAVHSNRFGPEGALILSLHLRCEEAAGVALPRGGISWFRMNHEQLSRVLDAVYCDDAFRPDQLWDQLAIVAMDRTTGPVPEWLMGVRRQLEAAPHAASIVAMAKEAGVHRVHLSREFSRHFGISPTTFRQKHMVAIALNWIVQHKQPPAIAAQEAGFSDQSHMIRTIKRVIGRNAGRLLKTL